MPIFWDELDTVAPDIITMAERAFVGRRQRPLERFLREYADAKIAMAMCSSKKGSSSRL